MDNGILAHDIQQIPQYLTVSLGTIDIDDRRMDYRAQRGSACSEFEGR
jgi:hypothetical protein